jgi:nitroreductase
MEFSALKELFATRRSIRRWKADPVPEQLLLQAVEAAALSPNSGGKQTYKCYVITNPVKIAEIGQSVQQVSDYLATLCKAESDIEAVERWRANSSFFAKAPALIAVSALVYQSIADKLQACNMADARVAEINRGRQIAASRIQTVGAFVDHLLLALHTFGLGAVWMAGPAQAKTEVERIIGMSDQEDFAALIPVGYPDEQPAAPARKPVEEFVTFIR